MNSACSPLSVSARLSYETLYGMPFISSKVGNDGNPVAGKMVDKNMSANVDHIIHNHNYF